MCSFKYIVTVTHNTLLNMSLLCGAYKNPYLPAPLISASVTSLMNGEVKGAGCVLGGGKGELKERKLLHKRPNL